MENVIEFPKLTLDVKKFEKGNDLTKNLSQKYLTY